MDCGPLNDPVNGEVTVQETTLGSIAEYSCSQGYVLSNEEDRTCQPNGKWSGDEPICEPIEGRDCGPIPDPVGGSVILSGTAVGSRADYSCDEGYVLTSGDRNRFCQDDLQWSGEPAICEGDWSVH